MLAQQTTDSVRLEAKSERGDVSAGRDALVGDLEALHEVGERRCVGRGQAAVVGRRYESAHEALEGLAPALGQGT